MASPAPAALPALQQKFMTLEDEMNTVLIERALHVETAIIGLISRTHHLQYGPPGTGKSLLVATLMKLIGNARMFRWLMTRHTVPEELFGPFSLKGLEEDKFVRHLDGKMIGADVAFLDEFFKANSQILNALLTLMNEGLFFNGTDVIEARPLIFSGSNELPIGDLDLAAAWDRIGFRIETPYLVENGSRRTMLRLKAASMASASAKPVLDWADVKQAQDESRLVTVPDDVLDVMVGLAAKLRDQGVIVSDRRWTDCIPIVQASAWRDGRTSAEVDDLALLTHVLWDDPKQISTVRKLVLDLANPLDKEAMELIAVVSELDAQVTEILNSSDTKEVRRRKGVEVNGKLTRAGDDLDSLLVRAQASPKRSRMIEEARARLSATVDRLLVDLFDVTD